MLDAVGPGIDRLFDVAFGGDVDEHALPALVCGRDDGLQRRARQFVRGARLAVVDAFDEVGLAFELEHHTACRLGVAGFAHERMIVVQLERPAVDPRERRPGKEQFGGGVGRGRAMAFAQAPVDVERSTQFAHRRDPRRKVAGQDRLETRHLIGRGFAGAHAQVRVPFPQARYEIRTVGVEHVLRARVAAARPDRGEALPVDLDLRVRDRRSAAAVDHGDVANDHVIRSPRSAA